MAARLEEQERMRSEFVANAAHELRTPLTNLLGYLEALRDGVIAPTQETFGSLREEVDRLVRLARSLDDLAVSERDRDIGLGPVDIRAAIETAVELALPTFERRDISVSVQVLAGVTAQANRDHVAQVLANLLQNAVRYTPDGGVVTLTAESDGRDVLVAVSNTGEGIPPVDLRALLPRGEVARPSARRRGHRSRDRQAARRAWRRARRCRIGERAHTLLVPCSGVMAAEEDER